MMDQEVSLPGRQKEEMIDIPDELTGGEQHVKVNFGLSYSFEFYFSIDIIYADESI